MNGLGGYSSREANWIVQSNIIFRGTLIQHTGATTADVRFDAAISADVYSQPMVPAVGDHVTMMFDGAPPVVGTDAIFFTHVYSDGGAPNVLELVQLGNLDAAQNAAFIAAIPQVVATFAANPLYARVASADRIVVGNVAVIDSASNTGFGSEHDPGLARAVVDVSDSLCGDIAAAVDVQFASSTDIAWYQTPKLAGGQVGVFLAHHYDLPMPFSILPANKLYVLDPLDVQPLSALSTIQALLATPP